MRLDRLTIKAQEAQVQARLADRHVTLKLTDHARSFLAQEGFDPVYGARPLRRTVQKYLMDPLAKRLLDGSLATGQTVTVDLPAPRDGEGAARQAGQNGADGLTFKAA